MDSEKTENAMDTIDDPSPEDPNVFECTWSYIESVFTWNFVRKILRTAMLVVTWISMGSYMEMSGPTLKDFVHRMGTDYNAISSALSGRSAGKFVGSIIGGFMTDIFGRYCDLQVAGGLTISALTCLFLPWVMDSVLLWFMYFILGTCLSIINIAGQRIVLCVWLEKAASPMHIVHLGYGIGGFLAPMIANPFLADFSSLEGPKPNVSSEIGNYSTTVAPGNFTTGIVNITTESPIDSNNIVSRVENAYIIVAIMALCVASTFYGYQVLLIREWREQKTKEENMPPEQQAESEPLRDTEEGTNDRKEADDQKETERKLFKKRTFLEIINPASCANGRLLFGCAILGFLFLRYLVYTGLDRNLGIFLHSYAVDQLNFTTSEASVLNSLFFIFYAVGRSVAFVVAIFVSVKVLLMIESVCLLIVAISAAIFARDSATALWVVTALSGFFAGPMFPSGIAWGNAHIDMTGMAITWVFLGSAIGGISLFKVAGLLYDKYGPTVYIFLSLGFCVALLALDIVLTVISLLNSRVWKNGQKRKERVDEDEKIDDKKEE